MAAAKWATVADVAALTGETVSEPTRTQAAALLSTVHGLIEDVERTDIRDRDRYFLKLSLCYQAAWMAEHPDLFSTIDFTSASQDGESVAVRNPDAHLLAPLARKAIRRLSWMRPGARQPGGGSAIVSRRTVNVNSEEYDDSLAWKPLR